jgi:predicted transcriptional regulator
MSQDEFSTILNLIANPVRRLVLKSLSREPDYALRLSKELGFDQQLVSKHLEILEKSGILTSNFEISNSGPSRKVYTLSKGFSISVDIGPNLYHESLVKVSTPSEHTNLPIEEELTKIMTIEFSKRSLKDFSKLIRLIDQRLRELSIERSVLIGLRSEVMGALRETLLQQKRELDERRVVYHVFNEQTHDPHTISDELNIDEESVKRILLSLRKELT